MTPQGTVTRILFACIGNSCRSQMAEAFCRELGQDVECTSAGSAPADRVMPETVMVMGEVGIDISEARPKSFRDVAGRLFDYMVAMGCSVTCPSVPGAQEVRWNIPDPFGKGILEYRKARDTIRDEVTALLEKLGCLRRGHTDDHQPIA